MAEDEMILLITGPNMSGKSTLYASVSINCFNGSNGVLRPCAKRRSYQFLIGFSSDCTEDDNLIAGQSTFMVEMMEANQALRHATPNSLILFDELGRGTATPDGMALAQAIIKYMPSTRVQAKTLFSTHYHELTVLEEELPQLKNVHVRSC